MGSTFQSEIVIGQSPHRALVASPVLLDVNRCDSFRIKLQ